MINEMTLKSSEVFMNELNDDTRSIAIINKVMGMDGIYIEPINCMNFKLYDFTNHPLRRRVNNMVDNDDIIIYHSVENNLPGFIPCVPITYKGRKIVLVNATNFAKKFEDIDGDGTIQFKYKFKSEAIFAELMHMAVATHTAAFKTNAFITNMRARESMFNLHYSMLMNTLSRLSAISTSPRARFKIKYLCAKFMVARLDMKWDTQYGVKISEVTDTEANILDAKYPLSDLEVFSSFINVLRLEFPHLSKLDVKTLIKVYSTSYGVQSVLCLDYIPSLIMLSTASNKYLTYTNTNIKTTLGKECVTLYGETIGIMR